MQNLKVMIVDSSPFSVKQIETKLSKNGIQIVAKASNKLEMLEQFNFNRPNFIIMDLTMPETDGFESIELLKSINNEFNSIIIGSVKMDEDLLQEVKKYKVDGYVRRPVKEDELITTVKGILFQDVK